MNTEKLKRANILANSLIPKIDELLNMSPKSYNGKLADHILSHLSNQQPSPAIGRG